MLEFIRSLLLLWYNLPFILMLGIALILALLQLIGFSGDDGADDGGEADSDADNDGEADDDGESDGGNSSFNLLNFIGFGKAPLMIVLLILVGSTGLVGLGLNWAVFKLFGIYTGVSFVVVLAGAMVAGALLSAGAAQMVRLILPPLVTTASKAQDLVGQRGTVISPYVDARYGQVRLRNPGGTLISIFAVTASPTPIKRGDEVILEAYDSAKRLYTVSRAQTA